MASLVWDEVGSRFYESGLDRCVLYLQDSSGVPWNGLISVSETLSGTQTSPIYYDGSKISDVIILGDFSASLKAYTYPDEFLEFQGIIHIGNGLFVTNQQQNRFGLTYRTKIGNDVDGDAFGYLIHVVYNLTAIPSQKTYQTLSSDSNVIEFEWEISSIPDKIEGLKPSSHLIFDTRFMTPLLLKDIETTLYGDVFNNARLPPIETLAEFVSEWVIIRIIDNYDGTWTAIGPDELITMLDPTTFQIIQANAIYSDSDTYIISDFTN